MSALTWAGLLLIVAVVLVAGFFVAWKMDKDRSHGVSNEDARVDPAERKRNHEARRRQGPRQAR